MIERSLAELSAALTQGEFTATDLVASCLARIEATSTLNSFLTVDADRAMAAAHASDQRRRGGGSLSPLDGIPLGLKDTIVTHGLRTTAGSKILADWIPPYDATVVRRLREAGAIILGKTNLDEFAMGSSTEWSAFGPVRNPWRLDRVPGGSSGGSAAAVAASQVPGALGSDTGGSIRQPAALCGIFGLKPTYGRISRQGLIAFASSLDQLGPMGRSVADLSLLLQVLAGFDPEDPTSAPESVPNYADSLGQGVAGLRIGVPQEYFGEGVDTEIEARVRAALEVLAQAGARLVPLSLPHTRYALPTYYVLAPAEASSNLSRYDGLRYGKRSNAPDLAQTYAKSRFEGLGAEVRRRIILGTFVLSAGYYDAYYERAQRVRTLIRRDFESAFNQVDLIAAPTSPFVAFPLGARTEDPLAMYQADVHTLAVSLAGLPALSAPAGFVDGLPVGLQLIAPWLQEARLLAAAQAYEDRTDHHRARPPLQLS